MVVCPPVKKMAAETSTEKDKLSKEEYIALVDMFTDLLNAYGLFSMHLGKVQKDHKEAYQEMFSIQAMEKLPEILNTVVQKGANPELSRLVISIFTKMAAFLPMLNNIMALNADEKIRLGENLKSLAKDFKKLHKFVENAEEKQ